MNNYRKMLLDRHAEHQQVLCDGPSEKALDHVQHRNKSRLTQWRLRAIRLRGKSDQGLPRLAKEGVIEKCRLK